MNRILSDIFQTKKKPEKKITITTYDVPTKPGEKKGENYVQYLFAKIERDFKRKNSF